ncbi:MAG: S9 family peptidase [Melioribacteraceae bacterium]|nr:S9 family peptidase [Melioribacteraceae bacterium]MCF8265770.1 S9 family peptidase [Melioribacteraceae bacterium]MCF8431695.1 S9 family peptidase [Melioribacteraceae bacterium]
MKSTLVKTIALFITLGISSCTVQDPETSIIPVKDFFRNPEKSNYQLSPNGEYLSFLAPNQNRLNIFIQKIGEAKAVQITNSEDRDIFKYLWANDDKLLYLKYSGEKGSKLYMIHKDGSEVKDLTPVENTSVRILDLMADVPGEILIEMSSGGTGLYDVYNLNLESGEIILKEKNPGNITMWKTDHDHNVRIAISNDGVNQVVLFREGDTGQFKKVISTNFREHLEPLIFTFDNKYVYASSNLGRDKSAIVKYDLQNNKELECIFEHPEVDVYNLMYSPKENKIGAVTYTTWKMEYEFFDEGWEKFFTSLFKKFEGYEVTVPSRSKDETKYLVRTTSDKSMGAYYYYDTNTDEFEKLADVSPWIDENDLSEMKPIRYKSRDGLTIHGYLTIPKGKESKNLPTIILPHGGPWLRDKWGYNQEVQFLANRGYAVLQMNYRGSVGYGSKFWEAGFKEWGQKMQNDVSDGVEWLISQGIADRERIGIFGYSFGGYIALAGLVYTPEYYKCGVSYSGLPDIKSFIGSIPVSWRPFKEMIYEMVGHPKKDSEMLETYSPVNHADRIVAPVFYAYGKQDNMIDVSLNQEYVNSLKANDVDLTLMVKEDEGHFFANEENRLEFFNKLEIFLDKNLNGRTSK